jgi:hypothetical protein
MLANKTFKEVPPRELPKKEVLDLIINSFCINSKATINEDEEVSFNKTTRITIVLRIFFVVL